LRCGNGLAMDIELAVWSQVKARLGMTGATPLTDGDCRGRRLRVKARRARAPYIKFACSVARLVDREKTALD
jgi:hypothetical protein